MIHMDLGLFAGHSKPLHTPSAFAVYV